SIPPDMSASYQSYKSTFPSLEEQQVGLALDIGSDFFYFSRLSRELLEVEEPEVLQYSLDRCYSTPSSFLELLNSYQPYRSAFYSLEEQRVGLALEVDKIEKYQEKEEDQNLPCPRLSRELLEVQEPKVLHDSVDRCYSTPTSYLELSDSCQPYRSAFYSLEKQHVGLVLGGDSEYLTMKVIGLHLVFQKGSYSCSKWPLLS
uniref:Olduvai domain-containing protein n=1 Tax=Theropithecus gelada TaxID=9565 RepID=A0A8D2JZZ0_THEGE